MTDRKVQKPALEIIGAIQALARGDAMAHQQQRAFRYIVDYSHNGGDHFVPGEEGDRDTAFNLGRADVARHLLTIVKLKTAKGGEQG